MPASKFLLPRLKFRSEKMERIDRMGWAAGICLESYGVRIGVRVSDPNLLKSIQQYLPPLWKPAKTTFVDFLYSLKTARKEDGRFHVLYRGSVQAIRTKDLDRAFQSLEREVEFAVAMRARKRLFVHAGVVGWRGRAIVIPGRTMSGKSNMVAALLRAGATYYSDEFALFDSRGRVYPYPRALRIRRNGQQENHPVEELGFHSAKRSLPVGLIAALKYKPGTRWRPRILSPAETILTLLDHTILARYLTNLTTLKAVASSAVGLKGNRDEANDVAVRLLKYLESLPIC